LYDGPVLVAISDDDVWERYCELEGDCKAPLQLRFLHKESENVYIIDIPTDIHEFYAREMLLQLARNSPYIDSLGAKTVNHKEADEFILPRPDCPNAIFPPNSKNCATVIIEVGLSQRWSGVSGLDSKVHHWFLTQAALEYIICVKIVKNRVTHTIKSLTYKVYDIAACNGIFPLYLPTRSFTTGTHH
jgi:hypothetical protein